MTNDGSPQVPHESLSFPHGINRHALPAHAGNGRAPRILILTVAVGTGHLTAANAIELALRRRRPDAHVENVDVLALATAPFRRCYGQMYVDFIDLAPAVLGYFYNLMDRPPSRNHERWDRLRIALERMSLRPFVNLVQYRPWDLIINTHFLPGEIIASLRRQRRLSIPQVMVTTDMETHRLWVTQPCEHYFTATEEAALYLVQYGVPRDTATATGIPIHPRFAEAHPRAACLARLGLAGDRPIVLQLAGGYGVGPIQDFFEALLQVETPLELVVITGRNTRARDRLQALPTPGRHRVRVLGYTQQMDQWLAVADLAVTKPGGLTTSECLAMRVPMVVINPVPGQEERNSDFLLENGAAIKINHLSTLPYKIATLLQDLERLTGMQAAARRLGRPQAAFEIVDRSLALLHGLTAAHEGSRDAKHRDLPGDRQSGTSAARLRAEMV